MPYDRECAAVFVNRWPRERRNPHPMSSRRPLIAGNWKMNGLKSDGLALAGAIEKEIGRPGAVACELVICPPATLVMSAADILLGSAIIQWGARG